MVDVLVGSDTYVLRRFLHMYSHGRTIIPAREYTPTIQSDKLLIYCESMEQFIQLAPPAVNLFVIGDSVPPGSWVRRGNECISFHILELLARSGVKYAEYTNCNKRN